MKFSKGSIAIIAIIGALVLIIIAGGVWYYIENKPIACTEEAKICPDGTTVSRTGPNCEFVECPIVSGCKNLWWYDNENTSCQGPKQFCGAYMYQGLQIFETKEECEQDLIVKKINFSETGNLMINNPGLESNRWYLSYAKSGAPGLSVSLFFDEESICFDNGVKEICQVSKLNSGDRITIKGIKLDGNVSVKELVKLGE